MKINKSIEKFIRSNKKYITINCNGELPKKVFSKIIWRCPIQLILNFMTIGMCNLFPPLRYSFYRLRGYKIGKNVSLPVRAYMDPYIHPSLIEIGDRTIIGTGVKLLTHELTTSQIRIGRIRIGKDVVVGAGSIIRPGITIGDGAVIGANSFVNRDVKPKEFVGGVPIKHIKNLK